MKPALRLLFMSVSTSMSRPRSPSVCHHDATRASSGSTRSVAGRDLAPGASDAGHRHLERARLAREALPLQAEVRPRPAATANASGTRRRWRC